MKHKSHIQKADWKSDKRNMQLHKSINKQVKQLFKVIQN